MTDRTSMNVARRAAEILNESAGLSAEAVARRIVAEDSLDWDVAGADTQRVVAEVIASERVVDLRPSGRFSG